MSGSTSSYIQSVIQELLHPVLVLVAVVAYTADHPNGDTIHSPRRFRLPIKLYRSLSSSRLATFFISFSPDPIGSY
jgi:hypothetical protein